MEKRYWNELSNNEIEKLEKEWDNSDWKRNAIKNSNKVMSKKTSFLICNIVMVLIIFLFIFCSIKLMAVDHLTSKQELMYEKLIYIGEFISLIGIVVMVIFKKRANNNYIDNEYKKWLLKNHNIIK